MAILIPSESFCKLYPQEDGCEYYRKPPTLEEMREVSKRVKRKKQNIERLKKQRSKKPFRK